MFVGTPKNTNVLPPTFTTSSPHGCAIVAPGAAAVVTLPVRFNETPGAVVGNPFLIVRMRERGEWRVLARVRVTAGARGEPLAGKSVVVTEQKVRNTLSV